MLSRLVRALLRRWPLGVEALEHKPPCHLEWESLCLCQRGDRIVFGIGALGAVRHRHDLDAGRADLGLDGLGAAGRVVL